MIRFHTADEQSANGAVGLLDSTPMSGQVRLATHRPAGLIASLRVEGRRRDILFARDEREGLVVGIGIRSEKECFVDGRPEPECVGYLSALRLREEYRRGLLLGRGYYALHQLHQKGNSPYYLTTVLEDNQTAMRLLTSGRAGLPVYHDWGEIRTLLTNVQVARPYHDVKGFVISELKRVDGDELLQFLRSQGPRRQFFPYYRPEDFDSDDGLLAGLKTADILVAHKDGSLVGCIGVWDQSHIKSWKVTGYGFPFKALRQVHNLWARMRALPSWPEPGKSLNIRFLSLFCVREDDPRIATALIQAAHRLAHERQTDIVAWSLHEHDPFQTLAAQISGLVLKSRLFLVHWPQDQLKLPSRIIPPYLETGSL